MPQETRMSIVSNLARRRAANNRRRRQSLNSKLCKEAILRICRDLALDEAIQPKSRLRLPQATVPPGPERAAPACRVPEIVIRGSEGASLARLRDRMSW